MFTKKYLNNTKFDFVHIELSRVKLTSHYDNSCSKGLGTSLLHWGRRFQVVDNQPCEIVRKYYNYEVSPSNISKKDNVQSIARSIGMQSTRGKLL